MLVARTDADVPKHKGLTYFICDMEQEGVEVRPLLQITGEAEFNEVFFNEAFVPDENVIGGVGNGWMVAITTLMNERAGLGASAAVGISNDLDALVNEQLAEGFTEQTPPDWRRRLDELVTYWDHIVGLHDELGGYFRLWRIVRGAASR